MSVLDPHDLQTCVRCGLCLASCPTFRLTGMEGHSPRGRISAARALASGRAVDVDVLADYIDTCLGCRACEAVCPSGVPYGRILEDARAMLPAPGGPWRRLAERTLLWLVSRAWRLSLLTLVLYPLQRVGLLRVLAALARRGRAPLAFESLAGLPKLRLRTVLVRMGSNYVVPDDVPELGQVVLFTGCVQDAWARDVHWATIHVFTHAGYRVRVPHGQVCCGALHAHAGRDAAARALARRNLGPLDTYEGPIVVNAAGCGAKLKEYGEVLRSRGGDGEVLGADEGGSVAGRARDPSEVLTPDDVRRTGARPPAGLERIGVHDPCHLVHAQRIHDEPRELLRAAGYEVVDLPDGGRCCGAAGTFAMHHPDWARPLRDAKLQAALQVAPDAVAVANPGCLLWMASGAGAPRMFHPMQLLAMAMVEGRRVTSVR